MGKGNVTYSLAVSLNEADTAAIAAAVPGDGTAASKINSVAGGLLRDLARGGIMIAPEYAERIQTAIDTTEQVSIVAAVEQSAGKQGDYTVVRWIVDPTQIQFYQSLADNQGISLDQQLKSLMDYANSQGWFNTASPSPFNLLLDQEQYRRLQAMFCQDIVTGADVMTRLEANPSAMMSDEPDVILDSLRG